MSVYQDKLWSSFQSWYDREAPLRRALVNAFAGTLESLRISLQRLVRQRFYSSAEWAAPAPGFLEEQLRGPWRILNIQPPTAPAVYTVYRASSGEVGLSFKAPSGQIIILPRVTYNGPGLYRLPANPALTGFVTFIMGQVGLGAIESFKVITAQTPDYLKTAIEDRNWRTTQPTDPLKRPSGWADIRTRARHFVSGYRGGRSALLQALRYVDPTVKIESFREDWTSRVYAGFGFAGHFMKKVNPPVVPDRSYWTTIWKTGTSEVCRIVVRASAQMVNSQELKLILDQYVGDGIIYEIRQHVP